MEILDSVEDGAAPHELGEPGKQQVRFMVQIALERPARPLLDEIRSCTTRLNAYRLAFNVAGCEAIDGPHRRHEGLRRRARRR